MGRGRDFREPRRRGFDEGGGEPRWPDQAPQGSSYGGGYGGGGGGYGGGGGGGYGGGGFGGGGGGFDRGGPRNAAPSGPERDATVKWFNKEKGFGFVELGDGSGDAFLHIRAVEAAGHDDLMPGTRLTVTTAHPCPRAPSARTCTTSARGPRRRCARCGC